ncbi:MAG: trypsin-like peptidase domain-containing protein [Planctomycetaceae bacterium]
MRRAAALLLLAAASRGGELRNAEEAVRRAAETARPGVVTVITPEEKDLDQTGVVIAPGGVILTIRDTMLRPDRTLPSEVPVRFPGTNDTLSAKVIDFDESTGTVILQASGAPSKYLRIAALEELAPGMWVLLVGNAFGQGRESTPTVSLGIVAAVARDRAGIHAVHVTTMVNPGSIGAPVVDVAGDLVGIVAPYVTEDGQQSVVLPYARIQAAYARRGGEASRLLDRPAPPRRLRSHVADSFGIAVAAAAERARVSLVGVRCGSLASDVAEAPPAEGAPPAPPPIRRVPGKRPAFDRSSGLVVAADGLVLAPLRITGWPGPERPLLVDLPDGRELPARVVGSDERLRLVLLKVAAEGLAPLEEAPAPRAGRFAVALGFAHVDPEGIGPQVTAGIVSRTGALGTLHGAFQAIQTDAAVAGGNRGGPLVDLDGKLIGILLDLNDTEPQGYFTRGAARYTGNAGLGFAVPARVLAEIVPRLARGVVLKAAYLGMVVTKTELGLKLVEVRASNARGEATAAGAAGLQVGDVLLELAGRPLREPGDLRAALAPLAAGDLAELLYLRGGEKKAVRLALGEP